MATKIENLRKPERVVLDSYALTVGVRYNYPGEDVKEYLKISAKEIKRIEDSLVIQGFLLKGYYNHKSINPRYCLPVLIDMVRNHPDEMQFFINYFKTEQNKRQYSPALDLLNAIRFVLEDKNVPKASALSRDYLNYAGAILEEDFFPRYMALFKSEEHLNYAEALFSSRIIADRPYSDVEIVHLTTTISSDKILAIQLADMRDWYRYVLCGTYSQTGDISSLRPYALMLRGTRLANLGKYDEALVQFTAALKAFNKTQDLKNVFMVFISSYYLVMTYARIGTAATTLKLEQFLRKKDISQFYEQFIPVSLAYAYTNSSHKPDLYLLNRASSLMIDGFPARGMNAIGLMVSKYFDEHCDPKSWMELTTNQEMFPKHLLLRHEVSEYLRLTPEQRDELTSLYGTAPILTSQHRKTNWEWVIDDVMQQVSEESGAKQPEKAQKKERLVYFFSEQRDEVTPMIQTWLKSGRWSVPKGISMKKFMEEDNPVMDDTDKAMSSLCRKKNFDNYYYVRWPSICEAAPLLIDCDRVFLPGDIACANPVTFVKEDAYVRFVPAKDKSIEVESNVGTGKSLFEDGDTVVRKAADRDFRVITVKPRQAVVIKKLLELKKFPADAQEQVKSMLTRLDQMIDVHSPLLDSKSIPTVKGSPTLCARIRPASGMTYVVNILAHPAPAGKEYYLPGDGKPVIYDMVDGKTVKVKRNISGELASLERMQEEMPFLDDDNNVDSGFVFSLLVDDVLSLIDFAKDSPNDLVIDWEEGKALSVNRATPSSWNVGLKSTNDWFEVEGEVRVNDHMVMSMTELLEKIQQSRGRFVRLNETDYLEISGKLRKQLERIDALAVKQRNKTVISTFNAALLDDKALDGELKVAFDERLVKLRKKITESYDYSPKVPAALNAQLRPYQLEGFQWLARLSSWGAGACLADDMGLGKTVQTIAFLLLKASEGPALVVAPASVVPNWVGEINKFAPTLNVFILNKSIDRAQLIKDAGAYDVVLSTYGILSSEETALSDKKWVTVCLDEAHVIKNKDTKMSQAVMTLNADCRIILTGTPIQNHLGELWNLFRFINPGLLGSDESFRRKFVIPIQDHDKERQRALQRIIKPFMLRRTKTEVADDLPDKTDIVMPVELSDAEMAMYEAMRVKAANMLEKADKVDVNTLAEITRLRRAADSIKLIDPEWKGPESKISAFMDLVEEFSTGSNRMLVFSQFTSYLALVKEALDKAGIKYLYLDGSCSMKERERLVSEFRKGEVPLFIISLKAGGLGLNLPEANYVAHLDPWWNPAIEQQATDRAYRIGQKRNVTVYHFVSKNTIEEKIRRLHRTKLDLADSLLEGTDMASKLGVKEILELVNS